MAADVLVHNDPELGDPIEIARILAAGVFAIPEHTSSGDGKSAYAIPPLPFGCCVCGWAATGSVASRVPAGDPTRERREDALVPGAS